MLTINYEKDGLSFKDITKEYLEDVLRLYNQNEQNMYATGIDRRMSLKDITEKYLEVLVNSHEFFIGIFFADESGMKASNDLIGVLKGRIDYENSEEAWISSILIDNSYQNKGIGKRAVNAVMHLLKEHYDIKRIFIGLLSGNVIGKSFWQGMDFNYVRTIEQYIKLNQHYEDFIIMRKDLYKKVSCSVI